MARKKTNEIIYEDKDIKDYNLEDLMGERFGRYSKYIIQERALPDARDGLKPVQRRIIYAMNKEGNTHEKGFRKSAKTVGLVIGNYHPHGDISVYDAMVRMSQEWKLNYPLIEMHGNNGSIDDDPAAAMRYTEARLSSISNLMTSDLPYDTVPWQPNFDDTELEPIVLPSRIPALLTIGSVGIAAGYATNIPPFNLHEVMQALIYRIKKPKSSPDEIFEIIKGPDFPTGGILCGKKDLLDAMKTGKGKVPVRAKTIINKNEIIITEIPYEVVKQKLVADIDAIRIDKEIDNIVEVRDESDKNGLRIVIELKANTDPQQTLNYLYKKTDLQVNCNFNMVAIVNHTPKQIGVIDALDAFIDFRKDVIIKRSNHLLNKYTARTEVLDGLIKASSIMDKIIKVIKSSKDKKDVINNLMLKFNFSEVQAEAIANMRLYRLSNTDIIALNKEKDQLFKDITKLNKIISDSKELNKVIIKESTDIINNYSSSRKTEIKDEIEEIEINERKLISDETVYVTVSKDGYIKKVSKRSYSSSNGESTGIKDGDTIINTSECSTLNNLIMITEDGNFVSLPVYKIDEARWKDIGYHINKYIKGFTGSIIGAFIEKKNNDYSYVITLSEKGMIKKTSIKDISMPSRGNKAPLLMKLDKEDKLILGATCNNEDDILIITGNKFINLYSIKGVPTTGLKAKGVISNRFDKEDKNKFAVIINNETTEITCPIFDKKIDTKKITRTKRGSKGYILK